ncbi:MAG: sulfite exporter TauE/SafE family protein, partial [Burkholderiaceae bacterium]|nr:sulfite exporter TauE/SafE family protein [Burkholderiaceae bacterium]
ALQPLWTLFHLLVLTWGLMLLARARQPDWVSLAGRSIWMRVAPVARSRSGPVAAGMLWVFLPCGLLYSALLVASLSGGPLQGALSMALFAAGSSISLMLAPVVLRRLERSGNLRRDGVGTRAAGALLAIVALWALWHDMAEKILDWCSIG